MFTYLGLGSSSVVNSTAGTDRGKKTATRIWPWNKFPYRGVKVHRLFCEQSSLSYPTHWTIISIKAANHLMSWAAQLCALARSAVLDLPAEKWPVPFEIGVNAHSISNELWCWSMWGFFFLIEASLNNVLFQIIITFQVNVLCQIYTKSLQSQVFGSSASRYAFFFLLSVSWYLKVIFLHCSKIYKLCFPAL